MIGTSCPSHTIQPPDRLVYITSERGVGETFKVIRDANEIQTKYRTKSGTLAEHFPLDLRFGLPFSVSHDRMSRSSCQYSSVILTDWLRTWARTRAIVRRIQRVCITTYVPDLIKYAYSQNTRLRCYGCTDILQATVRNR
jgi:hypothetical protein